MKITRHESRSINTFILIAYVIFSVTQPLLIIKLLGAQKQIVNPELLIFSLSLGGKHTLAQITSFSLCNFSTERGQIVRRPLIFELNERKQKNENTYT